MQRFLKAHLIEHGTFLKPAGAASRPFIKAFQLDTFLIVVVAFLAACADVNGFRFEVTLAVRTVDDGFLFELAIAFLAACADVDGISFHNGRFSSIIGCGRRLLQSVFTCWGSDDLFNLFVAGEGNGNECGDCFGAFDFAGHCFGPIICGLRLLQLGCTCWGSDDLIKDSFSSLH